MIKPIELEIFSPVQSINDPLFDEKGLEVFIKRDDLIHPLISGNKWRKLKYTLIKARNECKNHLVTFGGAFSNHLLATSATAAQFGFQSTGFVRGEEVTNDMLFLCRLHGMELIFTDRERYRHKQALFDELFGHDPNAFFVDEGGASEEGVKGCEELVAELKENYDHILCACGTGTTAAGIIRGLSEHQVNTTLHAIPVLRNGHFIGDEIKHHLKQDANFELHTEYHFGGYAKTTPELINFIKHFVAATGILIDPVYTGKMLFALYNLARKDFFKSGQRILAIHTGGVWGLMGMKDKFFK